MNGIVLIVATILAIIVYYVLNRNKDENKSKNMWPSIVTFFAVFIIINMLTRKVGITL